MHSNDFDKLLQSVELATSSEKVQKTSTKDFDFDRLIWPVAPATFFSKYWEQQPVILSRSDPHYYSGLFSMKDVDSVIYFSGIRFPDIRLFKSGELLPQSYECRDGFSSINRLYEAYYQGSTISLNNLQHRWKSISFFCRNLEIFFSHSVNCNLYLTPKFSQGFSAHFDTHEVFILQISGCKRWRVYDALVPLPLPTEKKTQFVPNNQLGTPLHEVVLNPGDMIYIPRGYVHEALTSESSSLHLTLGIDTFKWTDLLSHALRLVGQQNVSFRKSLPVGFLNQGNTAEPLKHQFKELLELLLHSAVLENTVEQLSEHFIEKMLPLPSDQFTRIDNLNQINPETVVKKRTGMFCHILREEDSVSIQFPGGKVKGPIYIESALYFIANLANSEAFPIKSISNTLTENGKVVLVDLLVKQGLLIIVQ